LPSPAFNGVLKTIKDKCGGILDTIEHDNNIPGRIKYDPSDAFNFFKDMGSICLLYWPSFLFLLQIERR
jgi:hypothetical protein